MLITSPQTTPLIKSSNMSTWKWRLHHMAVLLHGYERKGPKSSRRRDGRLMQIYPIVVVYLCMTLLIIFTWICIYSAWHFIYKPYHVYVYVYSHTNKLLLASWPSLVCIFLGVILFKFGCDAGIFNYPCIYPWCTHDTCYMHICSLRTAWCEWP
jgi:hypothetical protein